MVSNITQSSNGETGGTTSAHPPLPQSVSGLPTCKVYSVEEVAMLEQALNDFEDTPDPIAQPRNRRLSTHKKGTETETDLRDHKVDAALIKTVDFLRDLYRLSYGSSLILVTLSLCHISAASLYLTATAFAIVGAACHYHYQW